MKQAPQFFHNIRTSRGAIACPAHDTDDPRTVPKETEQSWRCTRMQESICFSFRSWIGCTATVDARTRNLPLTRRARKWSQQELDRSREALLRDAAARTRNVARAPPPDNRDEQSSKRCTQGLHTAARGGIAPLPSVCFVRHPLHFCLV